MNILVGKRAWNIFAIFGQLSIVVGSVGTRKDSTWMHTT